MFLIFYIQFLSEFDYSYILICAYAYKDKVIKNSILISLTRTMKKQTACYGKFGKDLEIISFRKKVLKTLILKTSTQF